MTFPLHRSWLLPMAGLLLLSCRSAPAAVALEQGNLTGLEGTVVRGPIQPVCRVGEPCDAPFSASFEVWQQQLVVAHFASDQAGHYHVLLAPGEYTVIAEPDAPIWPQGQPHTVTVGPVGVTHQDLSFDTSIR